jgi:hypothetical protein
MRVILASGRGLLSGWLIAATVPLLVDSHSIAAWSAAGVGDGWRVGLAAMELLGAALFAFEVPAVAGFALLLASFVIAANIWGVHACIAPSGAAGAEPGCRCLNSVGEFSALFRSCEIGHYVVEATMA